MKKLVIIVIFTLSVVASLPGYAQETQKAQSGLIVETETHSIFKGLFFKVWEKLKSINPTQKQSAKAAQRYTAGIRGAESTDTLLKPYWKDDLTQDESFQAELQSFSKAQLQLDKGKLESAVKGFEQFLSEYQGSSLRPNALFAQSIGFAGIGDNEKSLSAMHLFIDENPNHPLIDEAKQIVSELSG